MVPQLIGALRDQGNPDILVVAGGVIPRNDITDLLSAGCAAVFGPGTVIPDAASELLKLLSNNP